MQRGPHRRIEAWAATAVVALASHAAHAQTLERVDLVPLAFPPSRDIPLVHPSRYFEASVSPSRFREPDRADHYLVDLERAAIVEVRLPRGAFAALWQEPGRDHLSTDLVYYAPEKDEAGFLVTTCKTIDLTTTRFHPLPPLTEKEQARPDHPSRVAIHGDEFHTVSFYVAWSLSESRELYHLKLGEARGPDTGRADFVLAGFGCDRSGRFHYFLAFRNHYEKDSYEVDLIRLDREERRVDPLYHLEVDVPPSGTPHMAASPDFHWFVLMEYSEPGYPKVPMYFIDLEKKTHRKVDKAPYTPYASVVDSHGRLGVGSNTPGLFVYDLATGKRLRSVNKARGAFHMVLSPKEDLIWVFGRNQAAVAYAWPSLRRVKRLAPADVFPAEQTFAGDQVVGNHQGRLAIPVGGAGGFSDDEAGVWILQMRP